MRAWESQSDLTRLGIAVDEGIMANAERCDAPTQVDPDSYTPIWCPMREVNATSAIPEDGAVLFGKSHTKERWMLK